MGEPPLKLVALVGHLLMMAVKFQTLPLTVMGANGTDGATCRIYDTMGRIVASRRINGTNARVSVPYANTYIVSVEVMGKHTVVRKISKNPRIGR